MTAVTLPGHPGETFVSLYVTALVYDGNDYAVPTPDRPANLFSVRATTSDGPNMVLTDHATGEDANVAVELIAGLTGLPWTALDLDRSEHKASAMVSRQDATTALMVWEAMLEMRSKLPALDKEWTDAGTAEVREKALDHACFVEEVYRAMPQDLQDGSDFDWDFVPRVVAKLYGEGGSAAEIAAGIAKDMEES